MTVKKGRIYGIISGIVFYVVLVYQGMLTYPNSSILNEFLIIPVTTVAISLLLLEILPKGKVKNTTNDKIISAFQFWAMIFFPIVLGVIALIYANFKGTFTGITWVIFGIVFSIALNGRDLIRGRIKKLS